MNSWLSGKLESYLLQIVRDLIWKTNQDYKNNWVNAVKRSKDEAICYAGDWSVGDVVYGFYDEEDLWLPRILHGVILDVTDDNKLKVAWNLDDAIPEYETRDHLFTDLREALRFWLELSQLEGTCQLTRCANSLESLKNGTDPDVIVDELNEQRRKDWLGVEEAAKNWKPLDASAEL